MSDETRNFFYHDPFISSTNNHSFSFPNTNYDHDQLGFDPQYMMSFTSLDGFDQFVQPNSEMFSMVQKDHNLDQVTTPNSSMSWSSNEAGGDEDKSKRNCQQRVSDHDLDNVGDDSSKKVESTKEKTGIKKKAEKKERQTRFAFMTKSEVDHLEDGYRWRKYGQKAVKNSPFPRSYYRCTTQKCTVKKRVERRYEDPSTVVTTYEGQHNHPIPSNMRGSGTSVSNHLFSSQSIPMNFSKDNNDMITNHIGTSSTCFPPDQNNIVHDYGLLQDMLPSMFFFKHEQH